ncbi:MAG: hypothetical protein C0467_24720 [Planctomycetaceae bacterium]|nr:hypothetical protein [Planctomycetaceae bacterium]
MIPSLLVAAAITAPAAPVPRDTVPNTTGPAPRVLAVRAEAGGTIWITAQVYQKQKVQQQFVAIENGKQVVKQQEVEQLTSNYIRKTLGDFGGKFATADGVTLSVEDANRRLKDGATLLITADGKPVDKGWLKAVNDDTVVMTAEGLGEAHFVTGSAPYPLTASPRLVMLGIDDKGDVRLPVNANPNSNNGVYYGGRGRGGLRMAQADIAVIDGFAPPPPASTTPAGSDGKKSLTDIKFDAYDVTGKLVYRSEALTRLKAGGLAIVAGDNRFPDENYLRAFREDLLVIVSGELVFQPGQPNPFDRATGKPAAAGQLVKPVPQPVIGIAAPAVIKRVQIQIEN